MSQKTKKITLKSGPLMPTGRVLPPDRSGFVNPFAIEELRKYFQQVADWHGYIKFLGLPDLSAEEDVMIDRLYVEPFVSNQRLSPDEDPKKWGPGWKRAVEAIAENQRLIILGDPGSGKSTLVSWIAWRLCRGEETAWTKKLGRLVPAPMVIREMTLSRETDTWEKLWQLFLEQPVAEPIRNSDTMNRLLENGQVCIMLDGLDELGNEETRRALHRAVWDGMIRFPFCRWIMTSRIVGYDLSPFHLPPFDSMTKLIDYFQAREYPDQIEKIENNFSFNVSSCDKLRHLEKIENNFSFNVSSCDKSRHLEKIENNFSFNVSFSNKLRHLKRGLSYITDFISQSNMIPLMYLTPFTDGQILEFATNWFVQHEATKAIREEKIRGLVEAVHSNPDALRLARIPILLNLMALIYRVKAYLPHGRTHVYGLISEAYLDSIDKFRNIQEVHFKLALKERWLAHVGFQMQLQREDAGAETQEVLAPGKKVIEWLAEAMRRDLGPQTADLEAVKFLEYIGRRSGLLLPRGEGVYAFTHLSFQEYFAARYLANQIMTPQWPAGKIKTPRATRKNLADYARIPRWKEVLVLLYELLAEKEGWTEDLLELQFGADFKKLKVKKINRRVWTSLAPLAELAAELSINPHSRLSIETRKRAWDILWELHFRVTSEPRYFPSKLHAILLSTSEDFRKTIEGLFKEKISEGGYTDIDLSECAGLADLSLLREHKSMEFLFLSGCTGLADLSSLRELKSLLYLFLSGCTDLTDLSPLQELKSLQDIDLSGCTGLTDISPLRELESLDSLNLSGCSGLTDLSSLQKLKSLQILELSNCTGIADLSPLRELNNLIFLNLSGCTSLADLSSLQELKSLGYLDLSGCIGLSDLLSIPKFKSLESLNLSDNPGLSDLSPIHVLKLLDYLNLSNCISLSDLSPLQEIKKLDSLNLSGCTGLTDLSPLRELQNLEYLNLSGCTGLPDLSPLQELKSLQRLDLSGCTGIYDLLSLEKFKILNPNIEIIR